MSEQHDAYMRQDWYQDGLAEEAMSEGKQSPPSQEPIKPEAFDLPDLEGTTPCTDRLVNEQLGRMVKLDPAYEYAAQIITHARALERLFWRERNSSSSLLRMLTKERAKVEAACAPSPLASIEGAAPLDYEPQPCCGEYDTCQRVCTPRGIWIGEQKFVGSFAPSTPATQEQK